MQKCNTILRYHNVFKYGKDASNFYMKEWNTNYIIEEKTKNKNKKTNDRGLALPESKVYGQASTIKTMWYWLRNLKMGDLFNKCDSIIRYPIWTKCIFGPLPPYRKIHSWWIKQLKLKINKFFRKKCR